jgi:RNA polymerase sigma-70 factor, ECF subfamily
MTLLPDREALEQELKRHHEQADFARCTELILKGYGPELYAFLHAFLRSKEDAGEVFSLFSERLWESLPDFRRKCAFRTWAYTIARNLSRNYQARARVRARVHVELPEGSSVAELAEQISNDTAPYLQTGARDGIARLRESLSEEERMLLSLRIDRDLAWDDLARVLNDGSQADLTEKEIKRESARLRQKFRSVKEKLAELARSEGLLDRES